FWPDISVLVGTGNLCFCRRRKSVLFSSCFVVLHLSSSFLRVFILPKEVGVCEPVPGRVPGTSSSPVVCEPVPDRVPVK
ncbi:hypothetical protein LINGRAHAP2_LOCUS5114, partial [Linum grandiflorum]